MAQYLLDTNMASFVMKRYGMQRMPLEARVWALVPAFLSNMAVQPWDSLSAERYATLAVAQQRMGKPLSIFDTMIAAHALAHELVLVTNDQAFRQVDGLRVEDWTKGPQRA